MFFAAAKKGRNDAWMYPVVFLLVIVGYMLGQAPLMLAIAYAMGKDPSIGMDELEAFEKNTDFTIFGINPNVGFILLISMFAFATLALYMGVKFIHKKQFKWIVTAFEKVDYKKAFLAFGIWLLISGVLEMFLYFNDPSNYSFHFNAGQFIPLLLICIFLLPIQTSLEEFVFRGYLMQGFGLLFKKKVYPLIATSILFALIHSFNPEIEKFGFLTMNIYYVSAGLFLGILVIMDDSLELALGVHAATNFYGATMVGYEGSVIQTDSLFTQSEVNAVMMTIFFVIGAILFLLLCARLYNWPSFKKIFEDIDFEKVDIASAESDPEIIEQ